MVESGNIPNKRPRRADAVPPSHSAPTESSSLPSPSGSSSSPNAKVPLIDKSLPGVRQVWHGTRNKFHLWQAAAKSVCGFWGCGTPSSPALTATFMAPEEVVFEPTTEAPFCKPCYNWLSSFTGLKSTHSDEHEVVPISNEFMPLVPEDSDASDP